MQTTILLVAVVALTMTIVANRRRIAFLGPKIETLKPMVHELEITDPAQIAAIQLTDYWYQEIGWQVYLPKGRRYRLCIATAGLEQNKPTTPARSLVIAPGLHAVNLKEDLSQSARRWTVRVDPDQFTIQEYSDQTKYSASYGGQQSGESTQTPVDQALFLFSRIYRVQDEMKPSKGPSEGLLLWIEEDPQPSTR